MTDMRRGLQYSISIHIILLILLSGGIKGCGHGGGNSKEKQEGQGAKENTQKIDAKPLAAAKPEVVQVSITHHLPQKPKKKEAAHAKAECPSGEFYGGLGIYQNTSAFGNPTVVQAVKGYPGDEIGLQGGDEILSPPFEQIKGEVGTEIDLTVKKFDGTVKHYTVVRDKICITK